MIILIHILFRILIFTEDLKWQQNIGLVKSEPSSFSIYDLDKSKNKTTYWDGVRNYQARNFIRDEMKKGDRFLFYHSNTDPTAVVGVCEVVKESYADHTQFDPTITALFSIKQSRKSSLVYG